MIKDDLHIALTFDTHQTEEVRRLASKFLPEEVVETHYMKSVWYVPIENREMAQRELSKIEELIYGDFYLVANRQEDKNTIYTSNMFL